MMGLIERVETSELLDDLNIWDAYKADDGLVYIEAEFGNGAYNVKAVMNGDRFYEFALAHEDNKPISSDLIKATKEEIKRLVRC